MSLQPPELPSLLDGLPVVVYAAGEDRLRYVSPGIERILGFPTGRWCDEPGFWLSRIHPDDRDGVLRDRAGAADAALRCEYRLLARDGRVLWVRDESVLAFDADGRRMRRGVLMELGEDGDGAAPPSVAFRDELTGLPDRSLLREHLAVALVRAREHDRRVALVHLGLDDFRLVNDGLGHQAGDEALRQVAERLRAITPPTNLVARPGGDEFCVMLADLGPDAEQVAEIAAGQIAAALEAPLRVDGRELAVRATIGVSLFPSDARDEDGLLKHAEAAMYDAKAAGRGGVAFYAGGTLEALEQLLLVGRLRRALERGEFELHYQPIFDLPGGQIACAEALLRWRDPERGMVAPLEFIPVAEYTGLIEAIGEWVVGEVCAQARAWRDEGLRIPVSFNASLRQFQGSGFAESLARQVQAQGLEATDVIVEITESTAMRDPQCVEPVLRALDEAGVRIAIDDFGTGYSSLARLRDMPVRMVKIDREFVRDAPHDQRAARLTEATIELVEALGMAAVGEGVETEDQRRFLADRGCPLGQGFHLARPMPAERLGALLRGGELGGIRR